MDSAVASYSDQTDIFDPRQFAWPVHVIGLGGIGSSLVLPLVKLGLRSELHLWDPDYIEPHNIPAQLIYRPADIGRLKAEVAKDFLEPFKDPRCELIPHPTVVTNDTVLSGVVISGVDSMKSRADIWECIKFNPEVPLYLDGRMGGEQIQLFSLNPNDFDLVEFYGTHWLFSDEEGSQLPCAARTVIHPPVVLAGLIIAQLTRFARELPLKRMIDVHVCALQLLTN
ncbi:MAG: ThiF family adenylyltransferase [Candidatus Saccharimonadales bacterium]